VKPQLQHKHKKEPAELSATIYNYRTEYNVVFYEFYDGHMMIWDKNWSDNKENNTQHMQQHIS
jgi:hypothetical protein